MKQSIVQVDAFTVEPFHGNPAAVCVLTQSQSAQWMQSVAQEMNLSETAFLTPQADGYHLRWFTPTTEVPLCGHATLASAHVLWTEGHLSEDKPARFHTKSGLLVAQRQAEWIELDFPANFSEVITTPPELEQALGVLVKTTLHNSLAYLVEVEAANVVRQLEPNFSLLKTLPVDGVIVTSKAEKDSEYDFISRFFAPGLGIDEDPVTGAAHCCLAPFWRKHLQKDEFIAYQASSRGGVVKVRYAGDERVYLSGQAVTVMRGELIY
ncbi:phenazine biosynthesis protein PhzF family [Stanieria cyanosphaera PCC 7437]|uniref:Phenazine biosynthesis protein PhzF family n=1 Tax=Stanieria cyanosphaera (strain ATCC 29371 / PCC 7437) TaxID=111780 RepID=K9XNU6_STAC7|nr:PhzF family phenazine biosynthesis protein [Stanieria cyanosphaera]AFZ34198.1 phenazine biosynthesis protein PhzF family [Stanieria cyanosphaera PCC 7437]